MFTNLKNPVLLWSGGMDSTLILAMMIEAKIPFDIVQFGRETWTREQKYRADSMIKEHNLKVFNYAPRRVSFVGEGDEISLVREYAFMGTTFPLVSDVIEGDTCIASLDGHKAYAPPMKWTTVIIGSRKDDKHYVSNRAVPAERLTLGETEFYAPLYDWTRDEVKAELSRRGMDASEAEEREDTGNISLCTKCLHGVETFCPKENSMIPAVQWDRTANLQAFRSAYALSA